ncbi:hypothetical protein A4X06_0g155 [Tilletia controversa]|uniref:Required for respiratory growth protein 7, mitochondrial n=1 Tax=Tilletia controversa TaxID=13291 RepID=A0A8X7N146_9BASI|nr:hypothetical protein CF328_g248 [Tilletia controversa]KAE8255981.1 hypothetical protein A4X06_0g155 [Tilletia controversa]
MSRTICPTYYRLLPSSNTASCLTTFATVGASAVGVNRHRAAFSTSTERSARARNVKLKVDDASTPPPQKRPRGRPRSVELDDASISPPKRPPGRPRKEEVTPLSKPTKRSTKAKTVSKIESKSKSKSKIESKSKTKTKVKSEGNPKSKTSERPRKKATSSPESILSTVAKGTAFEHLTLHLLRTVFGMSQLERTGGAGDRGIDLTGWWYPPPPPPSLTATTTTAAVARRVRVLVQCKYQSSTPLGPVHMRELEGTMYRKGFEARMLNDPDAQQTQEDTKSKDKNMIYRIPLLGILTSSTGFSSACARYSLASPFPLLLLHIPFSSSQQQALSTLTKQKGTTDSPVPSFAVLPNRAFVAPTGLMEGRLAFRSTRRIPTTADVEADEEVVREDGSAVEEAGDEVANELVLDTIDSPDILLDGRPLQERFPSA